MASIASTETHSRGSDFPEGADEVAPKHRPLARPSGERAAVAVALKEARIARAQELG